MESLLLLPAHSVLNGGRVIDTPLWPITNPDPRRTFLVIIPGRAPADEMGGAVINDDAASGNHEERRRPVI